MHCIQDESEPRQKRQQTGLFGLEIQKAEILKSEAIVKYVRAVEIRLL